MLALATIITVHFHLLELPLLAFLLLLRRLGIDEREHRFRGVLHLLVFLVLLLLEGKLVEHLANRIGVFSRRNSLLEEQ